MTDAYLSGGISGYSQEEYTANFKRAADLASAAGYNPVNPIEVDAACGRETCGDGAKLDDGSQMHSYGCYMKHDIKALLDCDIILMLPNWKRSSGAKFEWQVAQMCDIPVEYINEDYEEIQK